MSNKRSIASTLTDSEDDDVAHTKKSKLSDTPSTSTTSSSRLGSSKLYSQFAHTADSAVRKIKKEESDFDDLRSQFEEHTNSDPPSKRIKTEPGKNAPNFAERMMVC